MPSAPYTKPDLDIVGQIQPLWLYKRLACTTGLGFAPPNLPQYSLYTVPYGFNYLARRILTQWDDVNDGGGVINPEARVEVYNRAYSRARQSGKAMVAGWPQLYAEIPLNTISSPGGANTRWNVAPAPVDTTAFGVNMTATPVKSAKFVNLTFPYADTIEVRIVDSLVGPAWGWFPNYVDILIQGYLIPEQALAMWEGGRNG